MTEQKSHNDHIGTEDLYKRKKEKEEHDFIAKLLKPYSTFIVKYPSVIVSLVVIVVALSLVLSLVESAGAKSYPDFSKPTLGFRARGTMLSERETALHNLKKAHDNKILVPYNRSSLISKVRKRRSVTSPLGLKFTSNYFKLEDHVDEFMLFYQLKNGKNLFNHMRSLCLLYQQKIIASPRYMQNVATYRSAVHHIPNYIALLSNRDSCTNISTSDVKSFVSLLKSCVGYYKNETFSDCRQNYNQCNRISYTCRYHKNLHNPQDMASLFYNVFHFLADTSLVDDPTFLKITSSFDTIGNWHTVKEDYFRTLYDNTLQDLSNARYGDVEVVAYKLADFRFYIFETQLILQSLLAVTAIILVIIFIWIYSGSLFVALMTLGCVVSALIIAYFVFGRIFGMDFFPFLNMVTSIFIIGIGADDAFVYAGIWEEAKQVYRIKREEDHDRFLIKWTTHALRHAVVAMFVTSLTTAAAFLANISSRVTSVKCFGLYAGSSIIINYLLMVTFFPCVVVIHEKYFSKCMHSCCPSTCKLRPIIPPPDFGNGVSNGNNNVVKQSTGNEGKKISANKSCSYILNYFSDIIFENYLPTLICKYKFIFVPFFFLIGIGGLITTFVKPGLKPPSTSDFQMFTARSSIEQYHLNYKRKFAYGLGYDRHERHVNFIFGVIAADNGNKFDPNDYGSLVLNDVLDLASSQQWLRQFCENVRKASFYVRSESCSQIEDMFWYFSQPCQFGIEECCGKSVPLPNKEFMQCFKKGLQYVTDSFSIYRPLFDTEGELRSFVIPVKTNYQYSDDFQYNREIIDTLEQWTQDQMKNVTSESFRGWWHSPLPFYDLQNSLFEGTKVSLGIAIAVAFIVIFLTSLNVLLSLYSIITIAFIISVTVGSMVLDGWRLNIMESTVFSVAAGLSADFTLHYSVAYRTSIFKDSRNVRVKYAMSHIGPAIFMGATTTFAAGLVMVPSTVLVYIQMAEFLMLVMFISWLYSTFFFLPLCAAFGPTGYDGQLSFQKCFKKSSSYNTRNTEMKRVTSSNTKVAPEVIYDEPAS